MFHFFFHYPLNSIISYLNNLKCSINCLYYRCFHTNWNFDIYCYVHILDIFKDCFISWTTLKGSWECCYKECFICIVIQATTCTPDSYLWRYFLLDVFFFIVDSSRVVKVDFFLIFQILVMIFTFYNNIYFFYLGRWIFFSLTFTFTLVNVSLCVALTIALCVSFYLNLDVNIDVHLCILISHLVNTFHLCVRINLNLWVCVFFLLF